MSEIVEIYASTKQTAETYLKALDNPHEAWKSAIGHLPDAEQQKIVKAAKQGWRRIIKQCDSALARLDDLEATPI